MEAKQRTVSLGKKQTNKTKKNQRLEFRAAKAAEIWGAGHQKGRSYRERILKST